MQARPIVANSKRAGIATFLADFLAAPRMYSPAFAICPPMAITSGAKMLMQVPSPAPRNVPISSSDLRQVMTRVQSSHMTFAMADVIASRGGSGAERVAVSN